MESLTVSGLFFNFERLGVKSDCTFFQIMLKKTLPVLLFFLSLHGIAQRHKDYEVGPMLNFMYTSIYADNGIFEGELEEGFSNEGFEANYGVGVYTIYYFRPRLGLGAELFFQRTSTSRFDNDSYYNSLNFIPYVNWDPFRQIEGVHFGLGVGVSFIQEAPEYGSRVLEEDIRVITMPLKLSASYRIRYQATFELGVQAEVFEVIKDKARRNAIYAGLKIPINRVFGYYR